MQEIVRNPDVAVNFLVLMIVRLKRKSAIEVSATAFSSGNEPEAVHISLEQTDDEIPSQGWLCRIAEYFSR